MRLCFRLVLRVQNLHGTRWITIPSEIFCMSTANGENKGKNSEAHSYISECLILTKAALSSAELTGTCLHMPKRQQKCTTKTAKQIKCSPRNEHLRRLQMLYSNVHWSYCLNLQFVSNIQNFFPCEFGKETGKKRWVGFVFINREQRKRNSLNRRLNQNHPCGFFSPCLQVKVMSE